MTDNPQVLDKTQFKNMVAVAAQVRHDYVARLFQAGKTLDEIGAEMGISKQRVSIMLRKIGVYPKRGRRPRAMQSHQERTNGNDTTTENLPGAAG